MSKRMAFLYADEFCGPVPLTTDEFNTLVKLFDRAMKAGRMEGYRAGIEAAATLIRERRVIKPMSLEDSLELGELAIAVRMLASKEPGDV